MVKAYSSVSFSTPSENRKTKKFSVFRFNPASQAFPPSRLGIVQMNLPSALGLASVPFSNSKQKPKN